MRGPCRSRRGGSATALGLIRLVEESPFRGGPALCQSYLMSGVGQTYGFVVNALSYR